MRKILFFAITGIAMLHPEGYAQAPTSQTFAFTGSVQTFTVPSCVTTISITAMGAQGGANANYTTGLVNGGLGGSASGVLAVTPGNVLYINVGGQNGYNGGGAAGICQNCATAGGGIGGGASDVRLNANTLAARVIVAGGGGGAGGDRIPTCGRGAGGGGGGGYYGGGGGAGWIGSSAGGTVASPGTQTNGGTGGTSTYAAVNNGFAGSLGLGGAAGGEVGSSQGTPMQTSYPGGVGGGLSGGNGQSIAAGSGFSGQSGAGGSGYIGGVTSGVMSSGVRSGNGLVAISYTFNGGVVSITPSSTVICIGSSITLFGSGVTSYTWNGSTVSQNLVVSPAVNTSYTLTGTNSNACISSAVVNVSVDPGTPTLAISNPTSNVCLGRSTTLTASGASTYTWNNGITNAVSFTPATTATYVVIGGNACGTSSLATSITVSPLPVIVAANPATICAGGVSTISAAAAATAYAWSPTGANTPSVLVSPTSSQLYSVTVSDGICSGGGTVALTVNPIPTVAITTATNTVCEGDQVILQATGGSSYTWTPVSSNNASISVTATAATIYYVTGSNTLGCTMTANQVIVTKPKPYMTVSATSTFVCSGDLVTLSANGAVSYAWSNSAIQPTTNVNPVTTTVYSVTGTGTNNCTATETIEITILTSSVSITGPTVVCKGSPATLSASAADTYSWSNSSLFSAITVTPASATVYTLTTTTSSDVITCQFSTTHMVNVNPLPVMSITGNSVICRFETVTLTASGAPNILWNTGATTAAITTTGTALIPQTFTATGTDATGCSAKATYVVRVNPCTGIDEHSAIRPVAVFPNPASGGFTISSDHTTTVTISNGLGQTVITTRLTEADEYTITVKGLAPGVYFITDATGASAKVIVTD